MTFIFICAAVVLCLIAKFTTPYMATASLAYFLMCGGIWQRRNPFRHSRLMATAVLIDLSLVLILEFQRDAIKTATEMKLEPFQQAHIAFSTLAVLLYIPTVCLGILRYRGKLTGDQSKKWHRRMGKIAFCFRSIGFLLMFSMLSPNP